MAALRYVVIIQGGMLGVIVFVGVFVALGAGFVAEEADVLNMVTLASHFPV